MNTWPSIYREGALALSPHDVVEGNRKLDALLEGAVRCVRKRDTVFFFSYAIWTAILTGAGLIHLVNMGLKHPSSATGNVTLGIAFLSVVMLALTWRAWIALQNGKAGQRFGQLSGVSIPSPLQELIDSFASGARDARTSPGKTVPRELFAGRWAILLFSREESHRAWVRSSRGKRQKDEIFARPDASPDRRNLVQPAEPLIEAGVADVRISEPELCNLDPAMAWLVGGTTQHFAAGSDKFLDTLPPHQVEAFRVTLTVARRELRKGGQDGAQEEAIRIVRAELAKRDLLIRGTSRATIMKLIHGEHRGKDIRGYFA